MADIKKLVSQINEGMSVRQVISEATVNPDKIKAAIEKEVLAYMTSEGFDEDEARSYSRVTVTKDDGRIRCEVGAELSYDGLIDLANRLDSVISKFDRDAYFDADEPGIISAYVG